jgi:hypothetical protein
MLRSAGGNDDRQMLSMGPGTRLQAYRPVMQQMKISMQFVCTL